MWAIVGLGNPGRKYSATRHNVGFAFIKQVAQDWKVRLRKKELSAKMGETQRGEEKLVFVMPQTYMNRSGLAVKQIVERKKINDENLVVVYDDLDVPLGEIRIRKEGGPGTHKGMNSIVNEIKITTFPRIRIGIGPLPSEQDATSYVLSPFAGEEKNLLAKSLKKAEEALEMILRGEIEKAMNQYNKKGRPL